MKNIQKYRLGIQILCLILSIIGVFYNFKITMLVIMGLTLLSGVFYCGWVCPFGFLQDIFSKLGNLIGIKKRKMPSTIQKILVFSRYIIFVLVTFIGLDFIFSIMTLDPRTGFGQMLLGTLPSIGGVIVICFFVLISLFFERPFCNYLCYEGAKYGLISFLRIFTIKRDKSKCINCKKCDKTCPMNIEVSKCNNLRSPQCINCFQCVSSCPVKGTLKYGKFTMTKKEIKKYFSLVSTVLILIAAFIVYNIFNGTNPLDTKKHSEDSNEISIIDESKTITPNTPPSTSSDKKDIDTEDDITSIDDDEADKSGDASGIYDGDEADKLGDASNIYDGDEADKLGDASGISNGVYTGTGEGFRGPMTVEVTVKDQQITSVKVVEHRDDMKWFNRANNVIPDSIVEYQSTDIDLVSGATYSSIGIRDGVKDALENAK